MQTINLDISLKMPIQKIYAKQKDIGRTFEAKIFDGGIPQIVDENQFSVWYSGKSGDGNYSTINNESAFSVFENVVTVELIAQMLNVPGDHELCLIMSNADGNQIGLWNIPYYVEAIPGADSEKATQYFNELAGAANVAKESAAAAKDSATAAENFAGIAMDAANSVSNHVSYQPQALTEEQKAQARANIGAAGIGEVVTASASDELSDKYDLKDGYGYTEDVYIATDGTETALTGKNFKCVDYVPVKGGTSYIMYGVGYAIYNENKAFVSAVIDTAGVNALQKFTPEVDGFVRLTINSEDIRYARFTRTVERTREIWEYEEAPNPFFNPRIPCNVHLYGDSNSSGYGLGDPSQSWANRLGALIERFPDTVRHYRLSGYADKKAGGNAHMILPSMNAQVSLTAYTSEFTIYAIPDEFAGFFVFIDGQHVEIMTPRGDGVAVADNGDYYRTYKVPEGVHKLELMGGYEGTNTLRYVETKKIHTFSNHAVGGYSSMDIAQEPEGNIDIVMLGGNDRHLPTGITYDCIWEFYRKCKAADIITYFFTPAPLPQFYNGAEISLAHIIAQLPPDHIDIYSDLLLINNMCESLYQDDEIHLNERGHELLYAIAASKLGLAALNSEIGKSTTLGDIDAALEGIIAIQESLIGGVAQ